MSHLNKVEGRLNKVERRWLQERDRRYTEVKLAEEKALRVKEEADREALELARQIQTYKDQQANELREQINRERNLYASDELQVAPSGIDIVPPLTAFTQQAGGERTQQRERQGPDGRVVMYGVHSVVLVVVQVIGLVSPHGCSCAPSATTGSRRPGGFAGLSDPCSTAQRRLHCPDRELRSGSDHGTPSSSSARAAHQRNTKSPTTSQNPMFRT